LQLRLFLFPPGLPDGTFSNKKCQFWVNFKGPCSWRCWYFLWPLGLCNVTSILFGILCGFKMPFSIFSPFWYVVPRKIWQPCFPLMSYSEGWQIFGSNLPKRKWFERPTPILGRSKMSKQKRHTSVPTYLVPGTYWFCWFFRHKLVKISVILSKNYVYMYFRK
jgi:hypothetical protein